MKSVFVKALVCSCVMAQVSFAGIMFQDDFSTAPLSNGWTARGSLDDSRIITDQSNTVLYMKRTAQASPEESGYSRNLAVAGGQQYLTFMTNFRSMTDATDVRNLMLDVTYQDTVGTNYVRYMLDPWEANDAQGLTYTSTGVAVNKTMGGRILTDQYYWAVTEVGPTSTRFLLLDDSGNLLGEVSSTDITISQITGKNVNIFMAVVPQYVSNPNTGIASTAEVAINDFKVLNEAFTTVPEPVTMVLLALGGLGLVRRNRRA
jgi:hypothetical protein